MHFIVEHFNPLAKAPALIEKATDDDLASNAYPEKLARSLFPAPPSLDMKSQKNVSKIIPLDSKVAYDYGYHNSSDGTVTLLTYSALIRGNVDAFGLMVKGGLISLGGKKFYVEGDRLHYADITANVDRDLDETTKRAKAHFDGVEREMSTVKDALDKFRIEIFLPEVIRLCRAELLKRNNKKSVDQRMKM